MTTDCGTNISVRGLLAADAVSLSGCLNGRAVEGLRQGQTLVVGWRHGNAVVDSVREPFVVALQAQELYRHQVSCKRKESLEWLGTDIGLDTSPLGETSVETQSLTDLSCTMYTGSQV